MRPENLPRVVGPACGAVYRARAAALAAALVLVAATPGPAGARPPASGAEPGTSASRFEALRAAIAEIEAGRRTTPLIGEPAADGSVPVTFLVRRDGDRVPRIVSDVTGWGERVDGTYDAQAGRMTRVGRTSWYALETNVASRARIEYMVAYAVGDHRLDPHNPRRVEPPPASEFVTPGYEPPPELTGTAPSPGGSVTEATIDSTALGGARRALVYTPSGSAAESALPVAVFLDMRASQIARVLDWAIARRVVAPVTAIFVDPHVAVDGTGSAEALRTFLGAELPAWVAAHRRDAAPAGGWAILGISLGGRDALGAALESAGVYGRVGLLIPGRRITRADVDRLRTHARAPLHVAILAGRYDQANIATARDLHLALEAAGHRVDYTEVAEGHSPRTWLHHLKDVLATLFPGGHTRSVPTTSTGEPAGTVPTGSIDADRVFRQRVEALYERFGDVRRRCANTWATAPACMAELEAFRAEELRLFGEVEAHDFTDIGEHNYWHRGRLKFPSELEQLLQQAGGR